MPMEEKYTYDSLVRFLYHDMGADEAVLLAEYLDEDAALRKALDDLQQAKTQLPKVRFNPSPAVLNNILQYSTKTALEAQL